MHGTAELKEGSEMAKRKDRFVVEWKDGNIERRGTKEGTQELIDFCYTRGGKIYELVEYKEPRKVKGLKGEA